MDLKVFENRVLEESTCSKQEFDAGENNHFHVYPYSDEDFKFFRISKIKKLFWKFKMKCLKKRLEPTTYYCCILKHPSFGKDQEAIYHGGPDWEKWLFKSREEIIRSMVNSWLFYTKAEILDAEKSGFLEIRQVRIYATLL